MQNRSFIFLGFLTLFTLSVIDNSRGPLFPLIKSDLGLLNFKASLIFALGSLGQFLANAKSSWWLKFSFKKSICFFQLMMFLGCWFLGLAQTQGEMVLYLGALLFGMGAGGLGSLANMLVILGTTTHRRRQFLSGLHAMYGSASFIAPFLVKGVLAFSGSWGMHFFLVSLFPLVALVTANFNLKSETPEFSKTTQIDIAAKAKLLIGLLFSSYVAGEVLVSSRMVVYLMDGQNMPWAKASLFLSYFFICLLAGRSLFAILKFPGKSFTWLIIALISSITFIFLGMYVNPNFLFLTGLSISIVFPCAVDWMTHHYGEKSASFLTTYLSMWIGMGLVIMHLLNGFISDVIGANMAMLMAPILLCFSLVALLMLSKTQKI